MTSLSNSTALADVHKKWDDDEINFFYNNLEDITNAVSANLTELEKMSLAGQLQLRFVKYKDDYRTAFDALQNLLDKKNLSYNKENDEEAPITHGEVSGALRVAMEALTKALIHGNLSGFDNNVLVLLPLSVAANIVRARTSLWYSYSLPRRSRTGGRKKPKTRRHSSKRKRKRAHLATKKRGRRKKSKRGRKKKRRLK